MDKIPVGNGSPTGRGGVSLRLAAPFRPGDLAGRLRRLSWHEHLDAEEVKQPAGGVECDVPFAADEPGKLAAVEPAGAGQFVQAAAVRLDQFSERYDHFGYWPPKPSDHRTTHPQCRYFGIRCQFAALTLDIDRRAAYLELPPHPRNCGNRQDPKPVDPPDGPAGPLRLIVRPCGCAGSRTTGTSEQKQAVSSERVVFDRHSAAGRSGPQPSPAVVIRRSLRAGY
jgi:hypothetical protein